MSIDEKRRSTQVREEDALGVIVSKLVRLKAEYPDVPLMKILNNAFSPDINPDTRLHTRTDVEVAEALVGFQRMLEGLEAQPPPNPPPGHIVVTTGRLSFGRVFQAINIDSIVRIDADDDRDQSRILCNEGGERRLYQVKETRREIEQLLSEARRIR